MPALMSRSIPALRQALVAQGLTLKPTCRGCGQIRAPRDFDASGICRSCVAASAAASERRLSAWVPSLHNDCAADQPVTLARRSGAVRVLTYPARCRDCGVVHHLTPEYSQDELQAAWSAAEGDL